MTWLGRALAAWTLCVPIAGCSGICTTTEDVACSRLDTDAVSASPASSMAQFNDTTLSVVEATDNIEPSDGTCYARLQPSHVEGAPGASLTPAAFEVQIWCASGGKEFFVVSKLGDIRSMPVAGHEIGGTGWYGSKGTAECPIAGSIKASVPVNTGEQAPFPQTTTPDFQRTVQVDINLAVTTCAIHASVLGSFQLVVVAGNFHGNQDATCTQLRC